MLLLNINRKPYIGSPITLSHLTLSDLERSISRSLRFQRFISHKAAELGHMLLLNTNRKSRSNVIVVLDSPYMISYWCLIVTYTILLPLLIEVLSVCDLACPPNSIHPPLPMGMAGPAHFFWETYKTIWNTHNLYVHITLAVDLTLLMQHWNLTILVIPVSFVV